jgi:hypothetical protein
MIRIIEVENAYVCTVYVGIYLVCSLLRYIIVEAR